MASKIVLVTLLFLILTIISATKIPVLIWSPTRSMSTLPQSLSGKTVGTSDFSSKYLNPLSSDSAHSLVVFLQDKLSLEDFSNHADVYSSDSDGGAFHNLKTCMDEDFSVHLPAVTSPADAVDTVAKTFKGKVHSVKAPFDLNSLDLGKGQRHLIVVILSPTTGKEEEKVFAENDKQMAEVLQHLQKREIQYTALYTGQRSPMMSSNVASTGRHLLETVDVEEGNFTFVNGCLFYFARSANLTVSKNSSDGSIESFNVLLVKADLSSSTECTNQTARLVLIYKVEELTVTIDMTVAMNNTWDWLVNKTTLSVSGKYNSTDFTGEAELNMRSLWAPRSFSYHCSQAGPYLNMTANDTLGEASLGVNLVFDGLQFQPFDLQAGQFADPWDCVVFFSPGIWMAIIVVGLMIIILLYGISMIASINTMDRFDDPKGKTITVTVSD